MPAVVKTNRAVRPKNNTTLPLIGIANAGRMTPNKATAVAQRITTVIASTSAILNQVVDVFTARTWSGAGTNNNWSTATNWVGGVVPQSGDALVFGTIDRDPVSNVPILSPVDGRHTETGLPTADVTGQGGFCTLEAVEDPTARGFEFLVRFFSKANGNLLVTVRTRDVEQVFCTAQNAAAVTYADLTRPDPEFIEIGLDAVRDLNSDVARIIR